MKVAQLLLMLLGSVCAVLTSCSSAKKIVQQSCSELAIAQVDGAGKNAEMIPVAPVQISWQLSPELPKLRMLNHKLSSVRQAVDPVRRINNGTLSTQLISMEKPQYERAEVSDKSGRRLAATGFVFSLLGLLGLGLNIFPVLGALGLLAMSLFGITGLILSILALKKIHKSDDQRGSGLAKAGLVLGIIDCLVLVSVLLIVLLFAFGTLEIG
jgi:hypothetical protein